MSDTSDTTAQRATVETTLEERVKQVGEYASWQIRILDDDAEGRHECGKWQFVIELLSGAATFPLEGYKLGDDDLIHRV